MFCKEKEIDFEEIFVNSVEEAFKQFLNIELKSGRISQNEMGEYENTKLEVQKLIQELKHNTQWSDIIELVFKEEDFIQCLFPSLSKYIGFLGELESDSSEESINQLSRNISKLARQKLVVKINSVQSLFNQFLIKKLSRIEEDTEAITADVVKVLKSYDILCDGKEEIIKKLTEVQNQSSIEHAKLENSIQNASDKIIDEMNKNITELSEGLQFDFSSYINKLEAKLGSKEWPDSSIKNTVLSNIYKVLTEFRRMGIEGTCSFLKAVYSQYFSFPEKSIDLRDHFESVEKIVESIALIRVIYPCLEITRKTAGALKVDEKKSICLLYTDRKSYERAVIDLWKYVSTETPDLAGVFRVIVCNMTCASCIDKSKGPDIKMIVKQCLPDFMKSSGPKPEYNDLQANFEQIIFHCEKCLGSYERGGELEEYKKTLCSMFGEKGA